MKVHRSVLVRLQAGVDNGEEKYVPRIRPNFVVREGQLEKKVRFRQMTREEWISQNAGLKELPKKWFEWL
jgi:hypothetical protein